ncbi:antirestriction protein ArdA [Frischella perrara]|uniref:antirestriction protein ArdA n=1 Tax=Frischella perrara TaxID=1267021 RepID=UPI003C6D9BC0
MSLIHFRANLDCFQCLANVISEYDLGYHWIEKSGSYNLKELGNLTNYFDYEQYGHDFALEQSSPYCFLSMFITQMKTLETIIMGNVCQRSFVF